MAKKCPPGVVCVDNSIFILLFVLLLITICILVFLNNRRGVQKDHNIDNSVLSTIKNTLGLFPKPSYSFSNIENDVLLNPYAAPLRDNRPIVNDVRGGVPINVRTQGVDAAYRQVGILKRKNGEMIMPLLGRPLLANRDKWQFYTSNENNIKLPIVNKGRSCTNEYGCDNLYNGDSVYVEGINDAFTVTMYDDALPRYIPYV